jgi:hypothetical protein
VRLENDVLVTDTGAEVMCDLPMDAEWAVIETQEPALGAPHYEASPKSRR